MRLFLHGLGQSPESWDETIGLLGDRRAACPDLVRLCRERGGGYPGLYRGLAGYCGEFDGPLDLCGLSLGAVLALHYTLEHPERVRSLALVAGQLQMPGALLRLQNGVFRLMPAGAFAETGLEKREMIRLTASMARLDFSGRAGEVSCPVLVLCGERDRANRRAARQLAGAIPGARLRWVPGAGHEVNREAPGALARELAAFWSGGGNA